MSPERANTFEREATEMSTVARIVKRALIWLPVVLALLPLSALATALIAVRTPNAIVISIDSYERGGDGAKDKVSVCKIFKTGSVYFAAAGLYEDRRRGFDFKTIVANGFSSTKSFDAGVAKTERLLSQSLLSEMRRLKTEDPTGFALASKGGGPIAVVFAEFENGVPHMATRDFQLGHGPELSLTPVALMCPGSCNPNFNAYWEAGTVGEAQDWLRDNRSNRPKPWELAPSLVEMEIEKNPNDVRAPVTTLVLSDTGATWITNDVSCPIEVESKK